MQAVEIPGMVDHSLEAFDAGCSEGLYPWRATYPFGVTVEIMAADVDDAARRAGPEVLMLEDLSWTS
jgi:hypothetical protein